VVRFQGNSPPRNYLSRREQWRLLLLVMSLGLAIVLMLEARKPENWRWFEALDRPNRDAAGEGGLGLTAEPSAETPAGRRDERRPEGLFPGVRPDYLQAVLDDTTFRNEEKDAWFHLFAILADTDEAVLEKASRGAVSYVQITEQSDQYRGALMTLRGTLRRARRLKAPKNEYGITGYYKTVLQSESNPSDPVMVYVLALPEGFPTGMTISENVSVTGFFFKRWVYLARDKIRTAPVLLAKTVEWEKRPTMVREAPRDPVSLLLMFGAAAALSAVVVVIIYLRTRRNPADREALPRALEMPVADEEPLEEESS